MSKQRWKDSLPELVDGRIDDQWTDDQYRLTLVDAARALVYQMSPRVSSDESARLAAAIIRAERKRIEHETGVTSRRRSESSPHTQQARLWRALWWVTTAERYEGAARVGCLRMAELHLREYWKATQ